MASTDDRETVDWLLQEVHDLLDVSSVGLYEFIDLLKAPHHELSPDGRRQIADEALRRLLREDGVRLYRLKWSDWKTRTGLSADSLPADPWSGPDDDGWYVAVDRAA